MGDNCNILIDRLPTSVVIDGIEYALNTDYRYMILYEMANADSNLTEQEKLMYGLNLLYPVVPPDIRQAADYLLYYFLCGKVVKAEDGGRYVRLYDYNYDSEYIFAAFYERFNINLQTAEMHWWEYKALFLGLRDCKFTEIMNIRGKDTSGMDEKMKAEYAKLKERYKIPQDEHEDKEAERLLELLGKGGSIADI